MDFEVIPAILEESSFGVEEKFERIKEIEKVRRVQIDIVDGLFADKISVTPFDLEGLDWGGKGVDYHLMVDDPMAWVEEVVDSGGERLIAQVERMGSQEVFVNWVKGYDLEVGLALDVYTPVSVLEEEVLEKVDVVLLLGVKAGLAGQEFKEVTLKKIKELKKIYKGEIMVDGGIGKDNVKDVIGAGAESVAVGSYLWEGNLKERLEDLYEQ